MPASAPMFVRRVTDRAGNKKVKFSWDGNEIIMMEAIARRVAEWLLVDATVERNLLAFASPLRKNANAVFIGDPKHARKRQTSGR